MSYGGGYYGDGGYYGGDGGDGGYYGSGGYQAGGTYGSYGSRYGSYGGYGFYGSYGDYTSYSDGSVTVYATPVVLSSSEYTTSPSAKDSAIQSSDLFQLEKDHAISNTSNTGNEAGFEIFQTSDGTIYAIDGSNGTEDTLNLAAHGLNSDDTLVLQFHTHPDGSDDPRPDSGDMSGLNTVNANSGGNGVGIVYGGGTSYYYGPGSGSASGSH